MRGLQRTAPSKLGHPTLDTAATRDGERLLIPNDIGTNGAHMLVLQARGLAISPTYSDLHKTCCEFSQAQLAAYGALWSLPKARVSARLNQGEANQLGTARLEAEDEGQLF